MPSLTRSTTRLDRPKVKIERDYREPEGIIWGPPPPLKALQNEVASVLETFSSTVTASRTFKFLCFENTTKQQYYTLDNFDTPLSFDPEDENGHVIVSVWVFWILHYMKIDLRLCKSTRKAVRMSEAMACVCHEWRRWHARALGYRFMTTYPESPWGKASSKRGKDMSQIFEICTWIR